MFRSTILGFSIFFAFSPVLVSADKAAFVTKVESILVSEDLFGECMARLADSPSVALPLCKPDWVSFSCGGPFADELTSARMFDVAQVALLTNRDVKVHVDDMKQQNGYCFAERVLLF